MDYIIGFGKVVASSVSPQTKAIRLNVVGAAGDASGADGDEAGETAVNQETYTGLGLVVRPRPPTKGSDGAQQYVETVYYRTGDGLVPLTYRDLRLNQFFPAPKEASVNWVGYAGAFDANEAAFDSSGNPKSSTRTIYVPYAFSNGVPTKAHAIVIDGTAGNESIAIVHADGMAITMMHGGKNSVVVKNKAGDAYVEVNDDGIVVNGNLLVNGGATIGDPVAALPAAVATPLMAYIEALEALITTIAAATVPPTSATVTAFQLAMEPVKALIPATKTKIA